MHAWTLSPAESEAIVRRALELGINFFDTANCYSAGTSEEYLGRAIKNNAARKDVVLASKVYFNEGKLSKSAIQREIDGTLKRLGTDYLDLYIIHRFDYDTPIEETMEALNGLVKAGKVRALGASAMYGYQFYNMQLAARDNGWTPFVSMQNHYNPLYREDERELIPVCRQMNVALTPYSPLAAGRVARATWAADTLAQPDGQSGAVQIRFHRRGGQDDCGTHKPAGGKIRSHDDANQLCLAFCEGNFFAHYRRHEGRISRRRGRGARYPSDGGGRCVHRRAVYSPQNRRRALRASPRVPTGTGTAGTDIDKGR